VSITFVWAPEGVRLSFTVSASASLTDVFSPLKCRQLEQIFAFHPGALPHSVQGFRALLMICSGNLSVISKILDYLNSSQVVLELVIPKNPLFDKVASKNNLPVSKVPFPGAGMPAVHVDPATGVIHFLLRSRTDSNRFLAVFQNHQVARLWVPNDRKELLEHYQALEDDPNLINILNKF
jgi:hypothetical protein